MIDKNGTNDSIGIDRLKVAFLEESHIHIDFPSIQSNDTAPHTTANTHDDVSTVSENKLKTTRSGRRVSLQNKLSENLKKDSHETGRQTRMYNEGKKRDVDSSAIDGACDSTSDGMLKLSAIMTSTVVEPFGRLGSPETASLNATAVAKNSVGGWTHVNRVKKNQTSLYNLNIPSIVRKSSGGLAAQSTPKNVSPFIKEPGNRKCASTSKQQCAQPERTRKPGKVITVRDDSLIIMSLKDSPELPLSLRDKHDKMLWDEINTKLELPKIEPLIVTRLTRGTDSKHQNHPRLLRVTLKNATDVEDVLLASHLLKSDGNVRMLLDTLYSEHNLIQNILKESH
ncbi:unnamed protein product [Schistosoma curassoni]|uniref:FH2 domain-containing protein n=1 Tax=Schistosoma curassoni TaxID=6186 RepID=A0A183JLJ2_9TREM|nr:unnamed protein product [Schistosoma curassoni]